jgi:hypothetical protein
MLGGASKIGITIYDARPSLELMVLTPQHNSNERESEEDHAA